VILASVTGGSDQAAYLRGKLRLAGLDADAPLHELLDALVALCNDGVPDLRKWRDQVDVASWRIKPPDRSAWGLRADQIQAQQQLMSQQ
jgi:hypothetical protein